MHEYNTSERRQLCSLSQTASRPSGHLLDDLLLDLLNDLVDPDLDLLLLLLLRRLLLCGLGFLPAFPPLLRNLLLAAQPPSVPLVDEPLAVRDELRANVALLCGVLLVELAAELLEVTPDLPLLLLREQCARARAPEELLEAVEDVLLELLSAEVPDRVTVLQLRGVSVRYAFRD